MFVVDDLVSWLVGRLADAGYQKVSTRLRGSEQDRALRQAVKAALTGAMAEIGLSDREEADRVATQINKAFGKQRPVALPPGRPTLLEAWQVGIAGQLSVLDDAGQPAVSLPGVPVSLVAEELTGHLVREIMVRGSQPGPLTPLADQLNHDLTHLQGQRIEGMLARLLDEVGDAPTAPGSPLGPSGRPLAEVSNPFTLEVHHPVQPDDPQPGLPVLPEYAPREHDAVLANVVRAAADGASGIAVLVGGSSTGKTRACWQALELLRGLHPPWRLWHPIDPSRPQAALAELPGIGRRTVVWLNDAQFYLGPPDGTGEQVAAGLRELLRDPGRGPVLVLATLWPQFWDQLTARRTGHADPHAQARELLDGNDIAVPAAFTPAQLERLKEAEDPRLVQAATGSRDGQVIQYLAGAPDLLARYRHARPAAKALIHAAMDGRRLGMRPTLPRAFLEAAAPGYLTDAEWDLLPGDWLEQALAYTAAPCKGVRGPLAPLRPRSHVGAIASGGAYPAWQLADYLDQYSRRARRELIPPAAFWAAAATSADPADLTTLGQAAENRGLYRDAAGLYKQASGHGQPWAAARLVTLMHGVHPADQRPAAWAAAHASLEDPFDVGQLMNTLREIGAEDQFATLLARNPAAHVRLDNPHAVAWLLQELLEAGADDQLATLVARNPAAHVRLDTDAMSSLLIYLWRAGASDQFVALTDRLTGHNGPDGLRAMVWLVIALRTADGHHRTALLARNPAAHVRLDDAQDVAMLLEALQKIEADDQLAALQARNPAAHARLDHPSAVASLLKALRETGADDQFSVLASRAATHARLDHPSAVASLLKVLREGEAKDQFSVLASRAATLAHLDHPQAVASLLKALQEGGAKDQFSELASRAAAHIYLDHPYAVAGLLEELRRAGADGQFSVLASQTATHTRLDQPHAVARLLETLQRAGAGDQFSVLASRAAAHARLDDTGAVTLLLETLQRAGARDQFSVLASRAAAHARIDHPGAVALLLETLRKIGAADQHATLLGRDPATHVRLDDTKAVVQLLSVLREAGATSQVAILTERLPGAGQFRLFCEQERHPDQSRFGWESGRRPAGKWGWEEI